MQHEGLDQGRQVHMGRRIEEIEWVECFEFSIITENCTRGKGLVQPV
jgi:hypothetical protein